MPSIKEEKAIISIKKRSLYDIKKEKYVFVNKLIYWYDDLMIKGYVNDNYIVEDYGKTWVLSKEELENGE